MVQETGVALSRLEANHTVLCLRRTITNEGIQWVEQIRFEGCGVPGESDDQTANCLQSQMKTRLNRCEELEMLVRDGHCRPLLACGRILLDVDPLSNVVRPAAADLVDHAARGAALLVRCTGMLHPLWSPVIMNGACVAQLLAVLECICAMQNTQEQMLDCLRLFFCYVQHRWGMRCDVVHYRPNVQAPLFCYQLEAAMRLPVVVRSILSAARKERRPAQQVAAWVVMNYCGLRQRYAQDLELKCGTGAILFIKGDLYQLIKNAGGFEQQGQLWDSPHNLR